MTAIRVSTVIAAPPVRVWEAVGDISTHPRWMEDAVAIRFTSATRTGVGASFECDTKVGPFRLTDRMEIVEWQKGRTITIRHVGLARGTGRFTLEPIATGTRFTWEERLSFPFWLGAPVLRRIWRRSLANLKRLVEECSTLGPCDD